MLIMNKVVRLLLIFGGAWMLVVCIFAYLALVHPGLSTKWKQEQLPPEAVILFRLGGAGEILAETQEGNLYELDYYLRPPWKKVDEPSGITWIGMVCSPAEAEYVFQPPGEVKIEVSETCLYNESARYISFVLLENGEVWSWQRETYAYTLLAAIPLMLGGWVIGALILSIGAGLALYQKKKRNQNGP
jgi:hypothetical protein